MAAAKGLTEEAPTRRIDHPMRHGLDAFAEGLREAGATVELCSKKLREG